MSWPIGGAAALAMAALVVGCTQSPARQGAGAAIPALRLPARMAPLPTQVLLASAPAARDYDRDRGRADVPPPASVRSQPPATRVVRTAGLQSGVRLVPGIGVSSVRFAPRPTRPRPTGVLSITQVGLDPTATARDTTAGALDELERRLAQRRRPNGVVMPLARRLVYDTDYLAVALGGGGFGGIDYLPPVRLAWTTGSPYALGELGLDR